ncbi:MAG: 4-hydroxythreonine-4-phosphate dehydrogenase PdxA [Longimicrobiales bacterium]
MPLQGSPLAPRLALTLGDPRGIGPEVVANSVRRLAAVSGAPSFLVIGPAGTVADEFPFEFQSVGRWIEGGDSALAGRLAGQAIETAARLAVTGRVDAIVTGPIDKAALHEGGFAFAGHTEMLATLSGAAEVSMLMSAEETVLGGPLRVVLATTHVPLAEVPRLLTADLLVRQTRLLHDALCRGWAMERPRIALCAFNPHASDGGLFGDQEARVYAPALASLRAAGIDARGPFPADTVFLRTARGEFDAAVAPYHDVGMAAFKTASFGRGVNVTLGLPFVRTSPDHGVALDIAGTGRADPASMLEAIRLAAQLVARNRAPARA